MKALIILSFVSVLTACAPVYGPGRVAVGVGVEPVGYDGFYDDYYGPFYNGYWGRDNYFYYSRGPGYRYARDYDHHFRRDRWGGFHPVRGRAPEVRPR
jgi:hypothetical protein